MAITEKGFGFPFRIDPATGGVGWAAGADKIRQNVRVVLETRLGERPMLRDYGSRIHALVHEPNDDVLGDLIQTHTQQSLLAWEPRILVTSTRLEADREAGELRLHLHYVHTGEPVAGQMLVPIR